MNAMTVNIEEVKRLVLETRGIVVDKSLRERVRIKGEADFVTQVDIAVSDYLQQRLNLLYPNVPVMCEENAVNPNQDTMWILDPIDGTTNLVFDYKQSSVSLALLYKGSIVLGVVYNPFSEEMFSAERGCGAYLNGERIRVRNNAMKECLIEFGAGSTRKYAADKTFAIAREIFKQCLDIRRICSSALTISYIAAGRINGYFEEVLKPWDYAAAALILEEAGGVLTDWSGSPLQYFHPTSIVAGASKAHAAMLDVLRMYK